MSLVELQGWMLEAIVSPSPSGPLDGPIRSTAVLSAEQRMGLYRHSYRQRLLECLREMHPALRHALGEAVFTAFALDYLASRPPRSYSLFRLGADFYDHLCESRPAAESWPDFVLDVIRFEQLFLEVYDGEGPEDGQAAPAGEAATALPGEEALVVAVPGLRLFRSAYPVPAYVQAVRRGEDPAIPRPAPTRVAVFRRDFAVTIVALDDRACDALDLFLSGANAGEVADAVGVGRGALRSWLAGWATQGLLRPVRRPTGKEPS